MKFKLEGKNILIVGAKGQLGRALQQKYPEAQAVDSSHLDITSREAVENFDWSGTEILINAAAYTNVDGAESPEGRVAAWKVNATGVSYLAEAALKHSLKFVHISTDYVFDGTKDSHTEEEIFTPLSVYGQSKAAGDVSASLVPEHFILRTSWVIGEGKNFVRTMLGLAEKGISPTVVADQIGRLTFTTELVRAIDHLLQHAEPGTYNVTNAGEPASWAEVTREIFKLAGYNNLTVTDTTTTAYYAGKEGVAPRPLNSIMDLSKLRKTGFQPKDWHDDLKEYVKKELESK